MPLRTTCRPADDFELPLYFGEVFRNKVEVRQRCARNRLLMLPGDFEQPPDAVHVLGGERQIPLEGGAQQVVRRDGFLHRRGRSPLFGQFRRELELP